MSDALNLYIHKPEAEDSVGTIIDARVRSVTLQGYTDRRGPLLRGATQSACRACCQRTVADLRLQGLDAMDYKEHIDYDLVESTNPAFGRAVVRVNVFRNHRQVPSSFVTTNQRTLDPPPGAVTI